MTKSKRGLLKDTPPEMMVKAVLEGVVQQTKIDKDLIEDIVCGNVL